jgi:hypothetical protein
VTRSGDRGLLLSAVAVGAAAALALLIVPLYSSGDTLLERNGAEVLPAILVPIALAALPLAAPARHRRAVTVAAAVVLVLLTFVSSAGVFFLPSLVLLLLAARAAGRPRG